MGRKLGSRGCVQNDRTNNNTVFSRNHPEALPPGAARGSGPRFVIFLNVPVSCAGSIPLQGQIFACTKLKFHNSPPQLVSYGVKKKIETESPKFLYSVINNTLPFLYAMDAALVTKFSAAVGWQTEILLIQICETCPKVCFVRVRSRNVVGASVRGVNFGGNARVCIKFTLTDSVCRMISTDFSQLSRLRNVHRY